MLPARTDLAANVLRKIEKAENGIVRHELIEETVIFHIRGDELLRKRARGVVIHFTDEELVRVAGNIVTHNHLEIGSLSAHDACLLQHKPYEVRVVDEQYRYSMRLDDPSKPLSQQQSATMQKEAHRLERELQDELAERALRQGERGKTSPDIMHEVWLRLASKYGLIYHRERR